MRPLRGSDRAVRIALTAAMSDLAHIGESLNWTLGQVILAGEGEIASQIGQLRGLYDADARRTGMRAMLRRKKLDGLKIRP